MSSRRNTCPADKISVVEGLLRQNFQAASPNISFRIGRPPGATIDSGVNGMVFSFSMG
jgi:hypothetical protein